MTAQRNRQWRLAKRPRGALVGDELTLADAPVPEPRDGEILVRNWCLACEPTQLGWMTGDTYLPAVQVGEVMRALAGGEVIASRHPRFVPGQRVQGLFGFQEYAAVPTDGPYPVLPIPSGIAIAHAMAALSTTALTAYFGLHEVGAAEAGETVVISAAAGATGSVAGQLAKRLGCRVVGIAGGADKCRYVTDELGFDAAIDYKHDNLIAKLRALCPDGVDVYFDNVGGRVLDAVLMFLRQRGRVVLCGAISGYTATSPAPGPANYMRLIRQRGRMEGFIVLDFMHRADAALRELESLYRSGALRVLVDVAQGFEQAPAALQRLFTGENKGRQLVSLAEDDESPF